MSETLVVISKIKTMIKEKAGMNTSQSAIDALTRHVENKCEEAIAKARENKRKTVLDRDFAS